MMGNNGFVLFTFHFDNMDIKNLKQHIRTLITLEKSNAPVISCYINLSDKAVVKQFLANKGAELHNAISEQERKDLDAALKLIRSYDHPQTERVKGIALFYRGGTKPFFKLLQFNVPLPNQISIGPAPYVYNLVELKDVYYRFIVLISTEESARILEVNLGEVTKQVWMERPDLSPRSVQKWSKMHYQHHRKEIQEKFVDEKIRVLDKLISRGDYAYLILAGESHMTSYIKNKLPEHLKEKLIDIVSTSGRDEISDIVAATLSSFIQYEAQESMNTTELLIDEIKSNGMAVAGTAASLEALKTGQVDLLVLAKDYQIDPAWSCPECHATGDKWPHKNICPVCGNNNLKEIDLMEELVRIAERHDCQIETVAHNDALKELGGAGCLLRYLTQEQYEMNHFIDVP